MTQQELQITTTATETITHANAERHGRKYIFTYKRTNGGSPSGIDLAVHAPTPDGNFEQLGVGQLANGRLLLNLKEEIGATIYCEITADILAIIEQIKLQA